MENHDNEALFCTCFGRLVEAVSGCACVGLDTLMLFVCTIYT